ncbi:hypothetical protein C7447_103314 [Tenacibaculum adriaticum]|uniref:Uncharacterized protein n=1 Tax=Tenacibaculum adriaticum TaxID=413713 RepID=A0A5S5DR44_9FLAO|nr:hypothetical protein [Tenacibaculum adriaticum]TYP98144.1 hypothetical protein C7447_103314 [Tenacibaculum adriaticum]
MISTILLVLFLGFYVLYSTSKKVTIDPHFRIENIIQQNTKTAKLIGLVFLLITLYLMIQILGVASGTLIFFIALMTIGSIIILLAPLKYITYKNLALFFVLSICIEFLLF